VINQEDTAMKTAPLPMGFARTLVAGLCLLALTLPAAAEDLGLRVAPGFRVRLYAGPDLASDVYAMTLDAQGRVVVTSRGWVKVLHDSKGTGQADHATTFATTPKGGLALCFDGRDLLFNGDGYLGRFAAAPDRDEAAGGMARISPMLSGEHGGHGIIKGPDGWWYVIGGNDAGFSKARHATLPGSLVADPTAGALLRFTPDFRHCEVVAHGWRNPYRFDFNSYGDLFTYDSDTERDNFLPWYSPTRLYHVAPGGHHGWRLPGYMRSWCRPGYYLDTVDVLLPVGRGSPTGVVCYRHDQFPQRYRDGLFYCDWTFGKVYFARLEPKGASYTAHPEVFLETIGTSGFSPSDAAVGPDGSLFIAMGGRGTRGSVFKIEYVGDDRNPPERRPGPANDLEAVLSARQPLDAWSRARWLPLAQKLGKEPFAAAVIDEKREDRSRIRAVEVLVELFRGLPERTARAAAQSKSAAVRARLAWSLGRTPCPGFQPILYDLADDSDPRVRSFALTAMTERFASLDPFLVRAYLASSLRNEDKRVYQAAAHLAARLPANEWKQLLEVVKPTITFRIRFGCWLRV
jgi:glucose/arabinose dehydrogenase